RSDIWSAGVVAWQLLAGRSLYGDRAEGAILARIATQLPPPLRAVRPDLPSSIEDVVARALCLDPAARWGSAAAFGEALQRAAAGHSPIAAPKEVAALVGRVAALPLARRRAAARAASRQERSPVTPAVSIPKPAPAERVGGQYLIYDKIAEGGMG